jgi:hypothetical protein
VDRPLGLPTATTRKWIARLAWVFWLFERASEKWCRGCVRPQSAGLSFLDGAMVLAVNRGRGAPERTPGAVRMLAEAGADLAVRGHYVFVAVAARGDMALAEWVYRRCPPSSEAVNRALRWAECFERPGMAALIHGLRADELALELLAHAKTTTATTPRKRL